MTKPESRAGRTAAEPDVLLQEGADGSTFPGMEARIASLEAHLEHVRRDVTDIKGDLATLRRDASDLRVGTATLAERLSHLPGKGFIVAVVLSGLAVAGGIVTVAPKLQVYFGAAPAAQTSNH